MNSMIKSVITFIKDRPIVRYYYFLFQYLFYRYLLNRLLKNVYLHSYVQLDFVSNSSYTNSFFGYYNISPFNSKGEILFGQVRTNETRGSLVEKLSLRVRISNNEIKEFGDTNAWNWQQGCMLQWYSESLNSVIYNDYSNSKNSFITKILNISTNSVKVYNKPIYSVAKSGGFGLTLNYDRLAFMRPDYGYFNKAKCKDDLPLDSEDGIWFIDLESNRSRLIISLDQLKNFQPVLTMEGAMHKVNHIDISPDGKRFMFLHRWIGPQGRFMRLLTANSIDGSDLYYVIGDKMVSHNCWWGNNDIVSFCKLPDGRNRYVHFKDKIGYIDIIGEKDFTRDGHPSVSPDGRWLLTDDYPDKSRFSGLYLFDLKSKKKLVLGKFFQPLRFKKENRIDLHPRWSPDGRYISIDSGHNGKRHMYILNIEKIVEGQ